MGSIYQLRVKRPQPPSVGPGHGLEGLGSPPVVQCGAGVAASLTVTFPLGILHVYQKHCHAENKLNQKKTGSHGVQRDEGDNKRKPYY